jgi:putative SOS response-associated peptidase YedK
MCGRYTDTRRDKQFLVRLGVQADFQLPFVPRYNIAPTQDAWIVAQSPSGGPEPKRARWGLIPSWVGDAKIGNSLINARSETVASKPVFRSAYKKRRCLVPADGFFEWVKRPDGKQPIYFRLKEGAPFAFGGMWEQWRHGDCLVESFCIITVGPNELCAKTHDRMPLILFERDLAVWLDPNSSLPLIDSLLRPFQSDVMECYPVTRAVNSSRGEHESYVQPAAATGTDTLFPAMEGDLFQEPPTK